MNVFTKKKVVYIAFLLCMAALTNLHLNAQNNYWNAQFTELVTGTDVSVVDVCGGIAYQLCITPDFSNTNCGNPTGTCSSFLAEVRDFCNPNEPYLEYELFPMDMGALSSIWCGIVEIPSYTQPNACPDIRISAAADCCPNLNTPPVIEIPFAGSCSPTLCCEAFFGGHSFTDSQTGNFIPESQLCGGSTVQFCTEIVYDATICNDPIMPFECIIVTAEPRDYCNPSILGNVQYLQQTASGLWCGTFDLPEYTSPNVCPDIRVIVQNVCCPNAATSVVEIPFAGSCNTSNPCCDSTIDVTNLFIDGTGGQNTVCEEEPFFLCANISTNAICDQNCIMATVSLINTDVAGNIDFFILESNIPFNNTIAAFCNDFVIPAGTMQAGINYELRIDLMNTCCENPETVASIPISLSPQCIDFCCDASFNTPFFSDANGVNIPTSDLCGGSSVQICMTVTGSSTDPASNCADCVSMTATARDYCNPNAPSETVVLDLMNIGNASNLYCAIINLPEYTSPNACPDIRVIGSNPCCPLLDEFVTEIPFAGFCNTVTCCATDLGEYNFSDIFTGDYIPTNDLCGGTIVEFCTEVIYDGNCTNPSECIYLTAEVGNFCDPNDFILYYDFYQSANNLWCTTLELLEFTAPNSCPNIILTAINECCNNAPSIVTEIPFAGTCEPTACCEGEVEIDNLIVYANTATSDIAVCEEEIFNLCFDVYNNRICDNEACLSANVELIGYTPNGIVSSVLLSQGNLIDFGMLTTITWCQDLIIPTGSFQTGVTYTLRLGIDDLCCEAEYIYETNLNVSQNCNTNICCATDLGENYFSDILTGMDILASDLCGGTVVEFCTEVFYDGNCTNPSECIFVGAEVRNFCGPTDEALFYDLQQTTNGLWCGTLELPEYTSPEACPDIRVSVINQCCNNIAPIVAEIPFAGTCESVDCCSGGYEISNLFIESTGGLNELCLGEAAWMCGFIESNRFCDATVVCTEMNIDLVVYTTFGSETILPLGTLPYFQFDSNNNIYQFCEQIDIPNGNIQGNAFYAVRLTINDVCCGDSFSSEIQTSIADCSPVCEPQQATNLREDNIICNGVTLAWDAVPNVAQYQIAGRVFGGNWQVVSPQTTTSRTFNANTIQPNTAYQWTVRTICDDGTMSDWIQPVRTFVTPVCRAAMSANLNAAKVSVYPNPAPQQTNIHLDIEMLDNGNDIMLKVYDMMGKIMIEQSYTANATAEMLDITTLPVGIYVIELNNGEQKIIEKLMVK